MTWTTRELVLARLAAADERTTLSTVADAVGGPEASLGDRFGLVATLRDLDDEGVVTLTETDGVQCRLTDAGRERAEQTRDALLEETVQIAADPGDGSPTSVPVSTAAERLDRSPVAVVADATDGTIHPGDAPEASLVGRETDLERIREALRAVTNEEGTPRGRGLVFAGPPGVGKTTLVERALTLAEDEGVAVLRGRATADGPPYQPLRDALRGVDRLAPDPFADVGPAADDPESLRAGQAALFADVAERVVPTGGDPQVLFLDDLHLADPGTLAVLSHLVDELADRPLLLLAAYRPAEIPEDAPVTPAAVPESVVDHVSVTPLDRAGTGRLVEGIAGSRTVPDAFVDAVHDRTGGVPLLVETTVEALLADGQLDPAVGVYPQPDEFDVPGEVRRTVERRVERFPAPARELLRWAATLAEPFEVTLLRAVADRPAVTVGTFVETVVDGGVLERARDARGRLRFRSEVVREALLLEMDADERRRRHRRVLSVLADADDLAADPAVLAHHSERAGRPDRAIRAYRDAAARAREEYAQEAALEYLERALDLARDHDPEQTAAVATEMASVHRTSGDLDDAQRFAKFARERAETSDQRRRALARLAGIRNAQGDHERAVEIASAGLDRADDPGALTCELLDSLSTAQSNLGRYDEATTTTERWQRIADRLDADRQRAAALHQRAVLAHRLGDQEQAQTYAERSLEARRAADDRSGEAGSLNSLGAILLKRERYDEASERLRAAASAFEETGDPLGAARALNNLGLLERRRSNRAAATDCFEDALSSFRTVGATRDAAMTLNNMGLVARERGDLDRARDHHEEALAVFEDAGIRHEAARCHTNLGQVAREDGDLDRARRRYERALEIKRDLGDREGIATSLSNLGRAALEDGAPARARERFASALEHRRAVGSDSEVVSALCGVGVAAREVGDLGTARERLREAADRAAEMGLPVLEGVCLAHLGAAALDAGDREAGIETGDAALERLEEDGAYVEEFGPTEAARRLVETAERVDERAHGRGWCRRASAAGAIDGGWFRRRLEERETAAED